jgi:D-alanine transaminase
MPRDAYVNGRYVPHATAAVHIEDRGFQFADGVYEVVTVRGGRPIDEDGHLDRLDRSLGALAMAWPCSRRALMLILRTLVKRNGVTDGTIYLQITRGVAPRDFRYPRNTAPTLVATTRRMRFPPRVLGVGVAIITIPDIRWKRRDIKTVGLLAQAMGKQLAAEQGAFEAWQVDEDGLVTEGCSSNAWIVTQEGSLVTRPATHDILDGVTRRAVRRLAVDRGMAFAERAFSVAEAYAAREAFMTSATSFVTPIVRIDGRPVGDGRPGPFATTLREAYFTYADGQGAASRSSADTTMPSRRT